MAKRVLRVLGLAVTWAFIWAIPAFPIEGLSNLGVDFSFTHAVDMWPQTLGIPGFIGGLFFALLLAVAGRLGDFESMSVGRQSGWGTVAGLAVAGFLMLMSVPESGLTIALVFGIALVSGAVAGPLSAWVVRLAGRKPLSAAAGR